MKHIAQMKANLEKAIRQVSDQKEQWVLNSKTDFTRRKKLDFPAMLHFLLQIEGSTIRNELTNYFRCRPDRPSPSAFYQQRLKIRPEDLSMLLRTFTASYKGARWKGFRLLAVDGSTVYTPRNEKDASSYLFNGAGKKGWNCVHINALYDLVNGLYVDAAIYPGKKPGEQAALASMLDRLEEPEHSILIMTAAMNPTRWPPASRPVTSRLSSGSKSLPATGAFLQRQTCRSRKSSIFLSPAG